MPNCPMCNQDFLDNQLSNMGMCIDCHERFALPGRTEPLRPRIPCQRCNHTSLVRCHVLRERAARGGDVSVAYVAPLSATFASDVQHTFWAGRAIESPDPTQPIGVFEAYVCRKCGYTELYARDAASIPIGDKYGTELFDVATESPYR